MGLGEKRKDGGVRCHVEREKEGEEYGYAPGQVNMVTIFFLSLSLDAFIPTPVLTYRRSGDGCTSSEPTEAPESVVSWERVFIVRGSRFFFSSRNKGEVRGKVLRAVV